MRRWLYNASALLFSLIFRRVFVIIINFDQGPNWLRVITAVVICFIILAVYYLGKLIFMLPDLLF